MLVLISNEAATDSHRSSMLEQYHYSQRLLEDERSISGSLREQLSQLKSDCNDREWKLLEQIAYLNSCSLKREEG